MATDVLVVQQTYHSPDTQLTDHASVYVVLLSIRHAELHFLERQRH